MSTTANVTANAALSFMSAEALSLVEQARKYRTMMEQLPAGDPNRLVYENIIRDLLDRASRISVFTNTSSASLVSSTR